MYSKHFVCVPISWVVKRTRCSHCSTLLKVRRIALANMNSTVFISLALTFSGTLTFISCGVVVMHQDLLVKSETTNAGHPRVSINLTVFNDMTHERDGQYTVSIYQVMNLYQAMLLLQREQPGKFCFYAIYDEEYGHYIEGINGVFASTGDKLFWGLYIFNVFSDKGVDSYYPQDGDHVIWKYMKYFSADVSVIDTIHGNGTLGSYHLDYVNLGTSLYQMMIRLESQSKHEFNFVTSVYARLGHYIEAIQGIWGDFDQKLYWAIYNHDDLLDKGVDCFIPEEGDHIKFKFMTYEKN
ncbi:uncharacterized protein [Ptychodera flava]|uniref:uncharacterized protein n=1 Tax=Ptychodera flava TaxID=63121 RepID=UPI00396A61ED